jgi:phosphatidylcholine synthase
MADREHSQVPKAWQQRAPAAAVHVFTACGIVCALLATQATLAAAYEMAFFWLGVALFIDGIDGTFARRFRVWETLPRFSGEQLDHVVDYVTYVFVPALMLLQASYIQGPSGLVLASLICLSSLYHFSDTQSKADDNCFVGFPAIWNIVALYIFALPMPSWMVTGLILACVALTFVPLKWVHPMRVKRLWPVTAIAVLAWTIAASVAIHRGFPATGWVQVTMIAVAIYGVALSLAWGRAKPDTDWT